jgi:hypothetical protein
MRWVRKVHPFCIHPVNPADMSVRTSVYILLGISFLALCYHLSLLVGLVPFDAAWGGRLKNREEMMVLEGISLIVQSILVIALLAKAQLLRLPIAEKWVNFILWFFVIVFGLNTVGNLFAIHSWERFIATPLTLISAILLWRVLRTKKE